MIIEPVGLTASIVLTNKLLRHGHGTWDMGHGVGMSIIQHCHKNAMHLFKSNKTL